MIIDTRTKCLSNCYWLPKIFGDINKCLLNCKDHSLVVSRKTAHMPDATVTSIMLTLDKVEVCC